MKLALKQSAASLLALSLVAALNGCGSGSSSSTAAMQYYAEPALPTGTTEITGIRGIDGSSDVYITGINQANGVNYGLLYQGPIKIASAGNWNKISPTGKCIITTTNPCEAPSGLNFYGPNNGSSAGNVVAVGNYNLSNDSKAYGLLYRGDVAGNGTYTRINPASLDPTRQIYDTIVHSNMNGVAVGNYDYSDLVGHAFIMAIGSTPNNPATYTYYPIPESLVSGALSMTAYGIWYNTAFNTYTIAGGYSKTDNKGITICYIVDWNPTTQQFSNFTSVYYHNDPTTTKYTHFEGITTDDAGGYYLAANWGDTSGAKGGSLVQITRNATRGFNTPTWTDVNYPGAAFTSANTVYRKNILGIFGSPIAPYLATAP